METPKGHRRVNPTGTRLSAIDNHFMDELRNDFRTFVNETLFKTVDNKPGFGNTRMTDGSSLSPYEQISGLLSENFESCVQGTQLPKGKQVPKDVNDFRFRMNRSVTEVRGKLEAIDGMTSSAFNQIFGIYGTFALQACSKANAAQIKMDASLGR